MNIEFTFKTAWRSDDDEWRSDGPTITDAALLKRIHDALEDQILVLEHWHYRGSRAPDRIVVDDYDDFIEYLKDNAIAGDAIHIFDITDALKDGKQLVHGKCPDEHGQVPRKGAY